MMGALTVPAEGLSAEPALAGAKSAGKQPSVRLTAEDVCRTYSAMVCRFAAMAAGSDLDADDLAQDALLKAIRSLDRFDPAKGLDGCGGSSPTSPKTLIAREPAPS